MRTELVLCEAGDLEELLRHLQSRQSSQAGGVSRVTVGRAGAGVLGRSAVGAGRGGGRGRERGCPRSYLGEPVSARAFFAGACAVSTRSRALSHARSYAASHTLSASFVLCGLRWPLGLALASQTSCRRPSAPISVAAKLVWPTVGRGPLTANLVWPTDPVIGFLYWVIHTTTSLFPVCYS